LKLTGEKNKIRTFPIVMPLIIIQFNSILYYLCAEPAAARPITDTAQCKNVVTYWTKIT
jgi:hypothetical protein